MEWYWVPNTHCRKMPIAWQSTMHTEVREQGTDQTSLCYRMAEIFFWRNATKCCLRCFAHTPFTTFYSKASLCCSRGWTLPWVLRQYQLISDHTLPCCLHPSCPSSASKPENIFSIVSLVSRPSPWCLHLLFWFTLQYGICAWKVFCSKDFVFHFMRQQKMSKVFSGLAMNEAGPDYGFWRFCLSMSEMVTKGTRLKCRKIACLLS